jgi:hypothetical protein
VLSSLPTYLLVAPHNMMTVSMLRAQIHNADPGMPTYFHTFDHTAVSDLLTSEWLVVTDIKLSSQALSVTWLSVAGQRPQWNKPTQPRA